MELSLSLLYRRKDKRMDARRKVVRKSQLRFKHTRAKPVEADKQI